VITREQWIEVESTVYEFWDLEMKRKKDYIPLTYNVQESEKSQENHLGIGAVSKMQPWTGSVAYQDFGKGFDQSYRHGKFSSGMQLEEQIFRFKEYNEIKRRTRKLLDAVYKSLQDDGASTFNNAFDDSFAGPDAVGLCSSAHDYSPTDGTHQENEGTYDLTPANVNTVFNKMAEFKDDKGDIVGVIPNLILCGNYFRDKAKKIVGSDKEPFIADNDMNTWKDELTYLYNPRITGKKWFLIDTERMKLFLNWYFARHPVIETDGDFDTENQKFKVVGMWSYGWDHWDWVFGNLVS
jgi:hypothetical protein